MNKKIKNSIIVGLAILFIGVFAPDSKASTLFHLYIPEDIEVLKAELNTYNVRRVPIYNMVMANASVRLVFRNNVGEIRKETLKCVGNDGESFFSLPIDVEVYYSADNSIYLEHID